MFVCAVHIYAFYVSDFAQWCFYIYVTLCIIDLVEMIFIHGMLVKKMVKIV